MLHRALPLLLLLFVAACDARGRDEPIVVSVAGDVPEIVDPNRAPPTPGQALLLEATAQGLVALDAEGQIAPALARRWIMLDDGLSYIFRLGDTEWDDGEPVTAAQIKRSLDAARAPGGGNSLAPLLADIAAVNAITPEILEITLSRPRADFLMLLAQPELAIVHDGAGLGPFAIAGREDGRLLLRRRESPAREDAESADPGDEITLIFEPMSRAVARFELGMSDAVLGGTLLGFPYAEAIEASGDQFVLDPVDGLFGLGFVTDEGFLALPENRNALAMAVHRERIVARFEGAGATRERLIVPLSVEGFVRRVAANWTDSEIAERRAFAADLVRRWTEANGEIAPLRVALPDLPGSARLFDELATGWRAIGVEAERVGIEEDADLRLIDRVAPTDSPDWYFHQFACGRGLVCDEAYGEALAAIAAAGTRPELARAWSDAHEALTGFVPFIPLLRPMRWSLISSRVTGLAANRYASHPLHALIAAPR